jgi:hypothetical protein
MVNNIAPVETGTGIGSDLASAGRLHGPSFTTEAGEGAAFRAELAHRVQQQQAAAGLGPGTSNDPSRIGMGAQIMGRATAMAEEMQSDQKYVSKMLETATRTGDAMHLMKAMMALNDYQTRVQFVSKIVSKATSSLDQLTKLQ